MPEGRRELVGAEATRRALRFGARLRQLEALCHEFDILRIVDDIQMGNGRTGTFFSVEEAGLKPDLVTFSTSIGGGLPTALLRMPPAHDQWRPREETGTFRGNDHTGARARSPRARHRLGPRHPEARLREGVAIVDTAIGAVLERIEEAPRG